jgi:hypothetical protein
MVFRPVVCIAILLALSGCSQHSDTDDLARARRNLRIAPCGAAPAVVGVAGVHESPREVYLGDWIVVTVCHLDSLVKTAEAQQQPVTLYIEGLDFGVQPTGVDLESGTLIFALHRDEVNKPLWKPFLYNPLFDPTVPLRVSAGIHRGDPLPRAAGANLGIEFHKLYIDLLLWGWLAFLAGIVVALFLFARKSDLVREGPAVGGVRRPYSLARAQMAWWFFLVLIGYNLIWMVTGDRDTIPLSLLGLLGISAVTALAAVAIGSRGGGPGARRRLFDGEIASLDEALREIAVDIDEAARRAADPTAATSTTAAALQAALEKKRADLEALRARLILERAGLTEIVPSKGFWSDLVTDDRGAISLDRFQIVAWSLVLGGLFLGSVVWELTMPEFSPTLLALMGISSGTYIGFKLPASRSGSGE